MLCLFVRSLWRTCQENGTRMESGYNLQVQSRSVRKVSSEIHTHYKTAYLRLKHLFYFIILGTKHFLLMCNVRAEDSGEIKFVARNVESVAYLDVEGMAVFFYLIC